jgi:hypothetical protein
MAGVVRIQLADSAIATEPRIRWVYFGSDAERFYRVRAELGADNEIAAGPLVNEVADAFRDELLNFDETLEIRSELRWHATDLAERNVFTSGFLHACCCALVLNRLLASHEDVLVVVEDPLLGRRLGELAKRLSHEVDAATFPTGRARHLARGVLNRLRFVRRLLAVKRVLRRHLDPSRSLPEVDTLLVTWADPDTFEPGRTNDGDTFYGMLPEALRKAGKRVGFLAIPAVWAHPLDEILRNIGESGDVVVLPDEAVRMRDALAAAFRTLRAPARPDRPFVVDGVDLTVFIVDELKREWAKPRQLWALQFASLGRFLARSVRPAIVLHPFENQPWEKTLRLGLQADLPVTEVAGSQHTPISERWFPYFPSRRDLDSRELPRRLFVIGELWKRRFVEHGYPESQLVVAPGLRFPQAPVRARPFSHAGTSVLVAASIGRSDSIELVVKSIAALVGAEGIRISIKLHPKMGGSADDFVAAVLRALDLEALPAAVELVSAPPAELPEEAHILLYNTTSMSYEALAAGVPIVFVQSDFWFDIDPIPLGSGIGTAARTPEAIRAAVDALSTEDAAAAETRRARARVLLADAFTAGDADDFAAALLQHTGP